MKRFFVAALAFSIWSVALLFTAGCGRQDAEGTITIALMPKSKGNAYFIACRQGAEEAAREPGVRLLWDGPTEPDPARQNELVETWITRGVDVIAVAAENKEGISTVLRKARERGIKVVTLALVNAHPNLKLIMAICSPAVPGAAEAVKQAGQQDRVKVVGLGLPGENRSYVKEGITPSVILWNTMDLGCLTVHAAAALANGTLEPGATAIEAGRLGTVDIEGDNVLLGEPFVFTSENIDEFDF